jgi:hypothetical protein
MRDENDDIDIFGGINTGRAILVKSSFVKTIFRSGFDIVIPPSLGKQSGDVWDVTRKFHMDFRINFRLNILEKGHHGMFNREIRLLFSLFIVLRLHIIFIQISIKATYERHEIFSSNWRNRWQFVPNISTLFS